MLVPQPAELAWELVCWHGGGLDQGCNEYMEAEP